VQQVLSVLQDHREIQAARRAQQVLQVNWGLTLQLVLLLMVLTYNFSTTAVTQLTLVVLSALLVHKVTKVLLVLQVLLDKHCLVQQVLRVHKDEMVLLFIKVLQGRKVLQVQ
jgi:hypothetical protein